MEPGAAIQRRTMVRTERMVAQPRVLAVGREEAGRFGKLQQVGFPDGSGVG